MNYATLFKTIQAYVENDFPTTVVIDTSSSNTNFTNKEQIDTFIRQAEQRIYNSVQLPVSRKNVTGQCTTNNKYLSMPSDWLSVFSLARINADGTQEYLLNKDVEFIRESFPDPVILGPTPDADYNMELHYFYYPQSIVDNSSGTSWLGQNFDTVLLYGSLLEAYTYMKGEKDVNDVYIGRYNEALAMLKQLGEGKNRQDMYRTEQARYPVR
jgi:hypothetical protein